MSLERPKQEVAGSIFQRYYQQEEFQDRYLTDPQNAVEVIIPIIHTNELWKSNLRSFYRAIPIRRLLIGDGGCLDDSIETAKKFPRVTVLDHKKYVSLGYSIKKLIESVETEWFVYLHSDVYLPPDWFDKMRPHQSAFDWFGCPQQLTVMMEYPNVDKVKNQERPYAGSQLGRKAAFMKSLSRVDDDYIYRQEDFVFADLVQKAGYKVGKVRDTFHYHQIMHKPSRWGRKLNKVTIDVQWDKEEKLRSSLMLVKGCIKYLDPTPLYYAWIMPDLAILLKQKKLNLSEFNHWVSVTNPAWAPYFRPWRIWWWRIRRRLWLYDAMISLIKNILKRSVNSKKEAGYET